MPQQEGTRWMAHETVQPESAEVLAARRAAEEAYLQGLEGATVVYLERRTVCLIRMSNVRTAQDIFHSYATPCGPQGLRVFPHPWGFGARWGNFSIRPRLVAGGAYSNWRIFTDPAVIERTTRLLEAASGRLEGELIPLEPRQVGEGLTVTGVIRSSAEVKNIYDYLLDVECGSDLH